MSTLSSASTFDEVMAAYDDNASWEEDGSVAKARAFITAVRILIRKISSESAQGAERIRNDENLRQWRIELDQARRYVSSSADGGSGGGSGGGGGAFIHTSFTDFRS